MSRARSVLLALPCAVLFLAQSLPFVRWVPDDAYVSFQYARNLADGSGLVFNVGERVEGFSNLLWTLLLAVVSRVGGDVVHTAIVLSYVAGAAALVLMVRLIRMSTPEGLGGGGFVFASLSIAASASFALAFYATAGMETTLYLAFLVTGGIAYLKFRRKKNGASVWICLAAFVAAALTRPEGILFLIATVAFLLWRPGPSRRGVYAAVLAAFAVYTGVAIAKYTFYGGWIPNTFYAKPGAALGYLYPIRKGSEYILNFATKSGVVVLLPFAVMIPRAPEARHRWFYLWSMILCQTLFVVYVGADVLRFDRFALPWMPWVFSLAAMGLVQLNERSPSSRSIMRRVTATLAVVIVLLNVTQSVLAQKKYCIHDWMHAHTFERVGRWLGKTLPSQSTIVTNEIGAIRYVSGLSVIDMLGLTDDTVSGIRYRSMLTYGVGSSAWSTVSETEYLLSRDPAAIIIPSQSEIYFDDRIKNRDHMDLLWFAIFTDPRFVDGYRPVARLKIHENKFLYVFVANQIRLLSDEGDLPSGRCLDASWINRSRSDPPSGTEESG